MSSNKKTDKLLTEQLLRKDTKKRMENLYKTIKKSGGDIGEKVRKSEKSKEDKMPNSFYMDNPFGSNRKIDTWENFMKTDAHIDTPASRSRDPKSKPEMFYTFSDFSKYDTIKESILSETEKGEEFLDELNNELQELGLTEKQSENLIDNISNDVIEEWIYDYIYNDLRIDDVANKVRAKMKANESKDLEDMYFWKDKEKIDLTDDQWVKGTEEDKLRPMFKNLPNKKDRHPYDILRSGKFIEVDGITGQIINVKNKVVTLDVIDKETHKHKTITYDLVKLIKKMKNKEVKISDNTESKNIKIDTPFGKKFKMKQNK